MWRREWNWKDGAKRARSSGGDGECRVMDGKMVQRVRPQVSGIFSFYSIKRDPLPTRVRRWSCPGRSLSIICGSGVSTKVLVLNFSGNSPEGRDPSLGSRLVVEAPKTRVEIQM